MIISDHARRGIEPHPEIALLRQLAAFARPDSGATVSIAALVRTSQVVMALFEASLPLPEIVPEAPDHLLLKWHNTLDEFNSRLVVRIASHWMLFALINTDGAAAISKTGYRQDTASSVVDLVARYYQS